MKATEKQKIGFGIYYLKNKEGRIRYARKYYQEHRGELLPKARERYFKNWEKRAEYTKSYNLKRKIEVFNHYGHNNIVCARCGFTDIRALTIDHINGGGYRHRKRIKKSSGFDFYWWLWKNNYPDGYQILCMNCQLIKRNINNENPKRGGIM